MERIAKRIARAGICSRRDAEKLILEGKVKVDGKKITSPALNVTPGQVITVGAVVVPEAEGTRLWLYHKPAGLVTSARDEKGRKTIFDTLPSHLPRVISVGRLDLTNDGALARHLELPATGWLRRYRVRAHGGITPEMMEQMRKGVTVEGIHYGPMDVTHEPGSGTNQWLVVGLKEGKNREIRRVFEHFGCTVNRLLRVSYGPFQLGKLARGEVQEIPRQAIFSAVGKGVIRGS